jgi:hypothetical protein
MRSKRFKGPPGNQETPIGDRDQRLRDRVRVADGSTILGVAGIRGNLAPRSPTARLAWVAHAGP